MTNTQRLRLDEVEQRVCDIASEQLGIPRHRISPSDRIIEDLNCDSLDLVELLMEVEEAFGITLPENPTNPVNKAVFTRQPFRLSDLAELAYLQQGTGTPDRKSWRQARYLATPSSSSPFTPTRRSLGDRRLSRARSLRAVGNEGASRTIPAQIRWNAVPADPIGVGRNRLQCAGCPV